MQLGVDSKGSLPLSHLNFSGSRDNCLNCPASSRIMSSVDQFTLSIVFTYFRYCKICNIKITSQCKILIVPEEGWLGQPKYSTPTKKSFYVVLTSASFFFILYVKPIRSLLIQRTPAGSSFPLFAYKRFILGLGIICGTVHMLVKIVTSCEN